MNMQISKTVFMCFLVILLIVGCGKQENINDEYLMQIKNVGLRQGVFLRRYQLCTEYGKNTVFTPEKLKEYINEVMLSKYLFIQNAYDLGMHEENLFKSKISNYRVNLLVGSHPIKYEGITISKDEINEFYKKKSVKYDVNVILANSYSSALSLYNSMQKGEKIKRPNNRDMSAFPQFLQFNNITYGEKLQPDLFAILEKMKEGEISKPIYSSSIWNIVWLKKKTKNKQLKSFDDMKEGLYGQAQEIYKYKQQKQFVKELKIKYQSTINTQLFQPIISAYIFQENHGWIDKKKMNKLDLEKSLFQIDKDDISVSNFISNFNNQANQVLRSPVLTETDLSHFADDYIIKYLLYLDALEKGVDEITITKDKLENKEHRMLYTNYLREEIAKKVSISDDDVKNYYKINSDKWNTTFDKVASTVRNELMNKRMLERKDKLVIKLTEKYEIKYNESLLQKIADQLTVIKKNSAQKNKE